MKLYERNLEELTTAVKNEDTIAAAKEKAKIHRDKKDNYREEACLENFSLQLMKEEMS